MIQYMEKDIDLTAEVQNTTRDRRWEWNKCRKKVESASHIYFFDISIFYHCISSHCTIHTSEHTLPTVQGVDLFVPVQMIEVGLA